MIPNRARDLSLLRRILRDPETRPACKLDRIKRLLSGVKKEESLR
jgi:hypothetical protein